MGAIYIMIMVGPKDGRGLGFGTRDAWRLCLRFTCIFDRVSSQDETRFVEQHMTGYNSGDFITTIAPAPLALPSRTVQPLCSTKFFTRGRILHNLKVIEADGEYTWPLIVDSLEMFAGQRYSVVVNATQAVSNYWVRANPDRGNPGYDGGRNMAILRYGGAPAVDPTTVLSVKNPLKEVNLHALYDAHVPGNPWKGGADVNLNIVQSFNNAAFRFEMNGHSFESPTVPVLLQILNGTYKPQELLPQGMVIALPKNKVIEVSLPALPSTRSGPCETVANHPLSQKKISILSISTVPTSDVFSAVHPCSTPSGSYEAATTPHTTTLTPCAAAAQARLFDPLCKKCMKRLSVTSDAELAAAECIECGVVYRFMKRDFCGGCEPKDQGAQRVDVGQNILDRAIEHQERASEHRLNQSANSQNPALRTATQNKERLLALKKQSKADTVTIEMSLFIFPANGTKAKKYAKVELKKALLASPPSQHLNTSMLNFEEPTFGVALATKVHNINPDDDQFRGTVERMFNQLRNDAKLSDTDIKSKNIPLRVFVYEAHRDWSDDEDEPAAHATRSSMRSSRVASTARAPAKRKAACSISSTTQYTSSYRPRKVPAIVSNEDLEIRYDRYQFTPTTFTVDEFGNVDEHISIEEQAIKISRDWKHNVGDKPKGGYLAKGLMKYAFLGRMKGKMYAVFQCKPDNVTESQNLIDLTAELRLLALGQYFAESFAARAASKCVEIPSIRWNFRDAFLGTVTSGLLPQPTAGEQDSRSLTFKTFLAAPLLTTSGLYTERKFSGCDTAGDNVDSIGRAIDAFAHHILVDTDGGLLMTDLQGVIGPDKEVILFDPQAHSSGQNTGFWDGGRKRMQEWSEAHKCETLCKQLGLKGAVVDLRDIPTDVTPQASTVRATSAQSLVVLAEGNPMLYYVRLERT
ncbi:hypothetical protein D9615_002155 [Tricholomella constricta]|uniref:laccase n=1 Tax=Tricholomella constricta TaxID=117010 RepID=A0A8H5HPL6_9AGAR|nr:hypothetical protein D9615_002155 [Tricholomella constricta]